jgi:hypothetical protein
VKILDPTGTRTPTPSVVQPVAIPIALSRLLIMLSKLDILLRSYNLRHYVSPKRLCRLRNKQSTVSSGYDWESFVCTPSRTHRRLLEVFLKSNSLAPSESNSQRNCPQLEYTQMIPSRSTPSHIKSHTARSLRNLVTRVVILVTWLLFLSLVCYSCYLVTKVKEEWESQQCPRYEHNMAQCVPKKVMQTMKNDSP